MAKKTTCPITRDQFRAGAKPVTVAVNGEEFTAGPKEFSTGSLGWYLTKKVQVTIDGVPVDVQIGMNLTVVGSKELPGGPGESAAVAAEPQPEPAE